MTIGDNILNIARTEIYKPNVFESNTLEYKT